MTRRKDLPLSEYEGYLLLGMGRHEIARVSGYNLDQIWRAKKAFGPAKADRLIKEYNAARVVEDWIAESEGFGSEQATYRAIADRRGLAFNFVEQTIIAHKIKHKLIPSWAKPKISAATLEKLASHYYRNTPVKVLAAYDGTTQIVLDGSPTWVPSCEVRQL